MAGYGPLVFPGPAPFGPLPFKPGPMEGRGGLIFFFFMLVPLHVVGEGAWPGKQEPALCKKRSVGLFFQLIFFLA